MFLWSWSPVTFPKFSHFFPSNLIFLNFKATDTSTWETSEIVYFLDSPFRMSPAKMFLWYLQQNTPKYVWRHNQYLLDPSICKWRILRDLKWSTKRRSWWCGCCLQSKGRAKRANKLSKHFIWFIGKIFSFLLINSLNANSLTLTFPHKLHPWE